MLLGIERGDYCAELKRFSSDNYRTDNYRILLPCNMYNFFFKRFLVKIAKYRQIYCDNHNQISSLKPNHHVKNYNIDIFLLVVQQ